MDGKERSSDAAEVMTWFVELFGRLATSNPAIARAHADTWPVEEQFFFRKLRLFALSKPQLFDASCVAEHILALNQDVFWDTNVARELVFLLVDRWDTFSEKEKNAIGARILSGPDQAEYWSDEDYPEFRDKLVSRYGRYLELQGCALAAAQADRLAQTISGIENWNDGWATSLVTKRGSHAGWVGTDEAPDAVLNLPVNEILTRAKADSQRDFRSFTEKRPFTGLVKANPRKALSALTVAGKREDYPTPFWSALIDEMSDEINPRLRRVFLHRLRKLPHLVIADLGHTLGRWLEKGFKQTLEFDDDLGWSVFDHIVDGIMAGGAEATQSGLGEVHQGGKVVERSRRTIDHAINGPVGMCARALLDMIPSEQQEAGSLIPNHIKTRIERLFATPGDGADHAISIVMQQLNWLMHMDPVWAEERLLPMLAFEHPASEPSWNGFLHAGRNPTPELAETLKPLLLALIPRLEQHSWDRDLSKIAANWLSWMCIFKRGEPDGLTKTEMRNVLRLMLDDTRSGVIFWLGQVGQKNENGWTDLVAPFLRDVWPRERVYRTATSVGSWIRLLDDTGDDFPDVYAVVKRFLVPVETDRHPFYRFTREANADEPLTARFPETTLDLVHTVTPHALSRPPYELPKILAAVAEAGPKLRSDQRYLRLIDLVERS